MCSGAVNVATVVSKSKAMHAYIYIYAWVDLWNCHHGNKIRNTSIWKLTPMIGFNIVVTPLFQVCLPTIEPSKWPTTVFALWFASVKHITESALHGGYRPVNVPPITNNSEYWPISIILTTVCRQNYLLVHLCYAEAVTFCHLWLVKKDMMTDRQKKDQNWTKHNWNIL